MMKVKTILTILVCSTFIVGCGGDKDEKKAPSQVLAKVNGKEITVLQLNYLLARQSKADNDTKQTLLDNLVEQELLVQQAETLKLDRNPEVLQSIEFAKRQVLAQAALEKLIGVKVEFSQAAISKYYQEHKYLFAERYIFDIDVFLVKTADMTKAANQALETSSKGETTKKILQDNNIAFRQTQVKRAAEELPEVVLNKMVEVNIGDIVKVPDDAGNMIFMQLIAKTSAPILEVDAEESIRQLLANTKMQNDAKSKIGDLKSIGNIEYLQRFSDEKVESTSVYTAKPEKNEHLKSGLKGLN
nr:EpsD family peptidyl-prolyl cis-trans isomerase [uncultured Tolumonas sp.]